MRIDPLYCIYLGRMHIVYVRIYLAQGTLQYREISGKTY